MHMKTCKAHFCSNDVSHKSNKIKTPADAEGEQQLWIIGRTKIMS